MQEEQPLRGFVVLVVDDDADNRETAAAMIESFGCGVLRAASSDEALAILDSGAHVDLVFSDVVMPKTSGKEVAERLIRLRPATRVLYMSGYTDDAIVHHGVLDANVEFIQKPFTPIALARKVREVLDVARGNQEETSAGRVPSNDG